MDTTIDPRDLELRVKQEEVGEPALSASTPKGKAGATPKKRKSTKKSEDTVGDEEGASPTKKQKKVAGKGIPDRYEDLSEEDKMMISWKEDLGKSYKEIAEEWFRITGNHYSGISVRYGRVKASLARVKDEDVEALRGAMSRVNDKIDEEKKQAEKNRWKFVAEDMEGNGADKYDAATLEKTWKRLQQAGATNGSS